MVNMCLECLTFFAFPSLTIREMHTSFHLLLKRIWPYKTMRLEIQPRPNLNLAGLDCQCVNAESKQC